MIIGIDASRNRSGGSISYLKGILSNLNPSKNGFSKIHIWGYTKLLKQLPNHSWLIKHNHPFLDRSLLFQIFWQLFILPIEFKKFACSILLNTDAGTFSYTRPCITMSRDMLSYEPGEMERYGWSFSRLRLIILKYVQNAALRRSNGVIFLTNYARKIIEQSCGIIKNSVIIPHGVNEIFRGCSYPSSKLVSKVVNVIYISNLDLYKHQWLVVEAISRLRLRYDIKLSLVGGGSGKALEMLNQSIQKYDRECNFVDCFPFLSHEDLVKKIKQSDLFLFASSCENMPNTLIEGMSSGLPILCSNRGPMPEVLKDGGIYFDPESVNSMVNSFHHALSNKLFLKDLSNKSFNYSKKYSWNNTTKLTLNFITQTFRKTINENR